MNKTTRGILDIIFFLIVFFVVQTVVFLISGAISSHFGKGAVASGGTDLNGVTLAVATAVSSVITLALFTWRRWAPVSRVYLVSHPWVTLCWVAMLALGSILPFEWLEEQLNFVMPEAYEKIFEQIMGEPIGYLAIGILAPLAEELVFRGAILRVLLTLFSKRLHWVAILISALIFGAVHGNVPQFVHATLIGLILGWMYYRTDSIIPGVVFHWINNTVAYVMFNLMPQMADGKLIDFFHGSHTTMVLGIVFSLCILLPSLFQLNLRLKKNQ